MIELDFSETRDERIKRLIKEHNFSEALIEMSEQIHYTLMFHFPVSHPKECKCFSVKEKAEP